MDVLVTEVHVKGEAVTDGQVTGKLLNKQGSDSRECG
jgi:hypothetical protein